MPLYLFIVILKKRVNAIMPQWLLRKKSWKERQEEEHSSVAFFGNFSVCVSNAVGSENEMPKGTWGLFPTVLLVVLI